MLRLSIGMCFVLWSVNCVVSQDGPPKDVPVKGGPKKEIPKIEDTIPKFFKPKPVEINVKDDELLKLQKEKVNLLGELLLFEALQHSIGRNTLGSATNNGRRYLEARNEITPSLADQLSLAMDYLAAVKSFHEQAEVRVNAGFDSKIGVLHFYVEIKWAEAEVLKLKRKIDAEKKKEAPAVPPSVSYPVPQIVSPAICSESVRTPCCCLFRFCRVR